MLSVEENELLTRVGPGSPMGALMREHWTPALMSSELPSPDGPPVRVRLLGEDLVAFRATSGGIGLLAHSCPHRRASLFFGRNEEDGLRCVYHGWKYDTEGRCVDMPSEPPESGYKEKIRATAYPVRERNGVVWAYMGPRREPPPLPDIEPNMLPEGQWSVWCVMRGCNWMQALEGDIDTAHLGFLHLGAVSPEEVTPGTSDYYTVADRCPRYEVAETEYGTMYGAYRPAEEESYYWRIAQFLFPFYTMIPTGRLGLQVLVRAWVPLDDHHTMFWVMAGPTSRSTGATVRTSKDGQPFMGTAGQPRYEPNGSGWLDRWRLATNASNDYLLDREVQRSMSFTGIDGILLQDQAITESMGPVSEREGEHLGSSDAMVIRTRRRLMQAARDLREGVVPATVDDPGLYGVRSGSTVLSREDDWLEATRELRKAFVTHAGLEG